MIKISFNKAQIKEKKDVENQKKNSPFKAAQYEENQALDPRDSESKAQ